MRRIKRIERPISIFVFGVVWATIFAIEEKKGVERWGKRLTTTTDDDLSLILLFYI
uniref:Uncharacterized protein n=1 Tax=Meloidogyne enterolobii TaxID=390850 RepID=A0A6V7VHR7_MELEN|nr:unnamed protein product [Meloidogyne enterolobii]